jgi:hypothetical protein
MNEALLASPLPPLSLLPPPLRSEEAGGGPRVGEDRAPHAEIDLDVPYSEIELGNCLVRGMRWMKDHTRVFLYLYVCVCVPVRVLIDVDIEPISDTSTCPCTLKCTHINYLQFN